MWPTSKWEVGAMRQRQAPGRCPVCGGLMHVTRLACDSCGSALVGTFSFCRFCQLSPEQQNFVEAFLLSRGNIREMERVLGVSYPTVRNRLDGVIEALGHEAGSDHDAQQEEQKRRQVLEALDKGELSVQEAIRQLREPTGSDGGGWSRSTVKGADEE